MDYFIAVSMLFTSEWLVLVVVMLPELLPVLAVMLLRRPDRWLPLVMLLRIPDRWLPLMIAKLSRRAAVVVSTIA